MKLKYDVYIFDFDGTLVKSNEIKYNSFFEITTKIEGSRLILEEILTTHPEFNRNQIIEHFVNELPNYNNRKNLIQDLINKYTHICEENIIRAPEIPGASEVLKKLNQLKKRVYISSATPILTLKRIIEGRGISQLIEDAFGLPKNKVDHLIFIQKITGISRNKMVMIGDSDDDYYSARLFGCDFIGIGNRNNKFSGCPLLHYKDLNKLIDLN